MQRDRAGTKVLFDHFETQVRQILEQRISFRHKLENQKAISVEDQAIYYSHWHYAATHVLVSMLDFQTKESISQRLSINLKRVSEILEFLTSRGLAIENGGRFSYGNINMVYPRWLPDEYEITYKLETEGHGLIGSRNATGSALFLNCFDP